MIDKNLTNKLKEIELIVSDVDGVLTDGTISISSSGEETKTFCVEDGTGVALAKYGDIDLALLSGRYSKATSLRAKELKITHCIQGFLNKRDKLIELCADLNISLENVAYIGDGLVDIPALEIVGCPISVPNAHKVVKEKSIYVSNNKGGEGVLYEIIELTLHAKNKYEDVIEKMKKDVY